MDISGAALTDGDKVVGEEEGGRGKEERKENERATGGAVQGNCARDYNLWRGTSDKLVTVLERHT